jgi:hypothetical protein
MKARIFARVGAGACALVACATGWAAFAPAASAVTGVQSGYWSTLPAAPQVPAGGLEVASDANGPQAVAAVKFTLADGETAPVLTLKVAQAQPQSQLAIEACAVAAGSSGWTPPAGGGPGAMASAPKASCPGGLVAGAVAADGSTVTFDLSLMPADGGVVDVVLQPSLVPSPAAGTAPGAPDDVYPTYDAAFKPVDAGAIAVTAGPPSSSGSTSTAPSGASGSAALAYPAPAPAAPPAALPGGSSTDAAAPAVPPVVASPQSTNAAVAAPLAPLKKRNLRWLIAGTIASSDLLFLLLWLERKLPADDRPLISIYDPPPASGGRGAQPAAS